jgi:YD repeat-containing protein
MTVSGTTVSIVYDAFGNRASKTVNGVTTRYLVEDDVNPTGYPQVLDELTGSTVTRTYTYGMQRISENQIVNNVWTPSFFVYDGEESVRQLTNTAGAPGASVVARPSADRVALRFRIPDLWHARICLPLAAPRLAKPARNRTAAPRIVDEADRAERKSFHPMEVDQRP